MNTSRIYRRLAELPVFTSASFISKHKVSLDSTVRDHVTNIRRSFTQEIGIPDELSSGSASTAPKFWLSTPVERSETIVGRVLSPSGNRTALLRETMSTPKKRFVEIWKEDCAELILETTSRHGSFYSDTTFSSLCFSPQEDALLYTAESNAPEEDPKDPFHKFRFNPHYGEQFIDRRRPTLFWLRWDFTQTAIDLESTEPVTKLIQINPSIENLPNATPSSHKPEGPPPFSLGQAVFASSSGRSVLATAYLRTAGDRRLGIAYSTNRPSMIVRLTLPDMPLENDSVGEGKKVEEKEKARQDIVSIKCDDVFSQYPCRSPRVWLPKGNEKSSLKSQPVAIWLSSPAEPYESFSRLHMTELPTEGGTEQDFQVRTVIDAVWEPPCAVDEGGFPGLYISELPADPFLVLDGVLHSVCLSNWGSKQEVIAIRLADDYVEPPLPEWVTPPASYVHGARKHQVFRLMPGGRTSASFVTCDGKNRIVVVASSLIQPAEVIVGDIRDIYMNDVMWHRITQVGERVKDLVSDLKWDVIDIRGREPVQTLLIRDSRATDQPMITWLHGGPQSVATAQFSPELVAFVLSGFTMSLPNYSGSLGYGQRWVEEILGKIGALDVEDVMASVKQMIEDGYAKEGPGMQFCTGGSHGGFLSAHVIGQYPKFFSAAILRNPVINIPSMYTITDMPDWTAVECGLPYDPSGVLTPKQYETMYRMSPVQYVDKVITPVLLRIGDLDQRAPPSQGREYYHLLKARGMGEKVEMMWYPENGHPLDKVEAERAGWEATLAWFKRYGPAHAS